MTTRWENESYERAARAAADRSREERQAREREQDRAPTVTVGRVEWRRRVLEAGAFDDEIWDAQLPGIEAAVYRRRGDSRWSYGSRAFTHRHEAMVAGADAAHHLVQSRTAQLEQELNQHRRWMGDAQ